MNVKRSLVMLMAIAMLASVFAAGPAAAVQDDDDCDVVSNNVLSPNLDLNANAVNAAANVPIASASGGNQYAEANQVIFDGGDQQQSPSANC